MNVTGIPDAPPPLGFRWPICPFRRAPILTYPVRSYDDGARLFLLTTASQERQTILYGAHGWIEWDEQLCGWRHVTSAVMSARVHRFVSEAARSTGVAAETWFDAPVNNPKPVHVRGVITAVKGLAIWPRPASAAAVAPPADPRGPVRIEHATA